MMTNEEAIEILKGIMDDDDNHNIAWAFGASDAFEMAIEALEKQIPKKPIIGHCYPEKLRKVKALHNLTKDDMLIDRCPTCRGSLEKYLYCKWCGQAIDFGGD